MDLGIANKKKLDAKLAAARKRISELKKQGCQGLIMQTVVQRAVDCILGLKFLQLGLVERVLSHYMIAHPLFQEAMIDDWLMQDLQRDIDDTRRRGDKWTLNVILNINDEKIKKTKLLDYSVQMEKDVDTVLETLETQHLAKIKQLERMRGLKQVNQQGDAEIAAKEAFDEYLEIQFGEDSEV